MTSQRSPIKTVNRIYAGPQTLADLIDLIEHSTADQISRGAVGAKRRIRAARTITAYIEQFVGAPAQVIHLDDLVGIDPQWVVFVEGQGVVHQSAMQYVRAKNQLLACANAAGWKCKSFELQQASKPNRAAPARYRGGELRNIDDAVSGIVRRETLKRLLRNADPITTLDTYSEHLDVSHALINLDEYFRSRNGCAAAAEERKVLTS